MFGETDAAAYLLHQDRFSSENAFCLNAVKDGFPICYASSGFVDLFGYTATECIGRNCGSLVGGPCIKADDRCLIAASAITGLSMALVKRAVDILTAYAGQMCKAMASDDMNAHRCCLALNCKKSRELIVCEFSMRTLSHPAGWDFVVGTQHDVTDTVSISTLLRAALANEHPELISAHEASVRVRRPILGKAGDLVQAHVQYFQLKAEEMSHHLNPLFAGATLSLTSMASTLPGAASHTSSESSDGFPNVTCSIQLARRRLVKQCSKPRSLVAVVRHGERADGVNVWNHPWVRSDDAKAHPCDPPLTSTGVMEARRMAVELSACASFDVVVSSPYLRCVQTAVALADHFGAKLVIDNGIGEMFTPKIFGDHEKLENPWRPLGSLADALSAIDASEAEEHSHPTYVEPCLYWERVVGKPPVWPENEKLSRRRYTLRYMTYLKRARNTRQNYILVGHTGLLEEALLVLPATASTTVSDVSYCAAVVAAWSRTCEDQVAESERPFPIWSKSVDGMDKSPKAWLAHESEAPGAISASALQVHRWEVGVQGIELHRQRRRPSKGCREVLGEHSCDVDKLLGQAQHPQGKRFSRSIAELSAKLQRVTMQERVLFAPSDAGSASVLTVSEAPEPTEERTKVRSRSPSRSPRRKKTQRNNCWVEVNDHGGPRVVRKELDMMHSGILARRASR